MKREVFDGRASSTSRTLASNRTIKISASIIVTFFGSKQPNTGVVTLRLFPQKAVIGSTPFAR
jgi:hypothetical protein